MNSPWLALLVHVYGYIEVEFPLVPLTYNIGTLKLLNYLTE